MTLSCIKVKRSCLTGRDDLGTLLKAGKQKCIAGSKAATNFNTFFTMSNLAVSFFFFKDLIINNLTGNLLHDHLRFDVR